MERCGDIKCEEYSRPLVRLQRIVLSQIERIKVCSSSIEYMESFGWERV